MKEYLTLDSKDTAQTRFKVSKTSKIDNLIKEKRFFQALDEINRLIEEDNANFSYWNLKGIILTNLKEYEKAIECFNKALIFNESAEILSNKAEALYQWAKITFFPENNYQKALHIINEAIECLSESEDSSEYYFLKAEILEGMEDLVEAQKAYLTAYKEFDKLKELESQINYLKNNNDTLIHIVGCEFYNFTPQKDIVLDLMAEKDNEHDPDAIAVLKDNQTVGYVANNPYTLIDEVESASNIKNKIKDNQKAEILFIYLNEYVIAKLL